jgi:hypothetical protein
MEYMNNNSRKYECRSDTQSFERHESILPTPTLWDLEMYPALFFKFPVDFTEHNEFIIPTPTRWELEMYPALSFRFPFDFTDPIVNPPELSTDTESE